MNRNAYKEMMSRAVPSAALVRKTKNRMIKEESIVIKQSIKLAFRPAIVVVVVLLLATGTVFAAMNLLKPGEVAEQLGNQSLSAAFNSENAININESQTADGYTFTLMSIVSGSDITDHLVVQNGEVLKERTYAVIAIQKTDGSPMLAFDDPDAERFYFSPFIKGFSPSRINSFVLSGGGAMIILDGVLYVITDVDDISIFADRGVYIGINSGFSFGDAFNFDEATGEISPNPGFDGVSVIFELPVNLSLADPEKAQALLNELLGDGGDITIEGEDAVTDSYGFDDSVTIRGGSESAEAVEFMLNVGDGLVSQQEMTRADYIEWMEKQLSANSENR